MTRTARSRGSATPSINGATGPTLTLNGTTVLIKNRTNIANVALSVQGMAGQTGNLTEWKDSAGVVNALVWPGGAIQTLQAIITPNVQDPTTTGPYIQTGSTCMWIINRNTVTNVPLVLQAMSGQTGDIFQTADDTNMKLSGFTANGRLSYTAGLTAMTVGAAGGAAALPATPAGYALVDIAGAQRKIPFYL